MVHAIATMRSRFFFSSHLPTTNLYLRIFCNEISPLTATFSPDSTCVEGEISSSHLRLLKVVSIFLPLFVCLARSSFLSLGTAGSFFIGTRKRKGAPTETGRHRRAAGPPNATYSRLIGTQARPPCYSGLDFGNTQV